MPSTDLDERFLEAFLAPIRKCANYTPAFGKGKSSQTLKVKEFQALYSADRFYAWLGLDSPLVYAAHKAAGGLTSVYRQIGVGSERLFRMVLSHSLSLSKDDLEWSYEYDKGRGKVGVHTLDAHVALGDLSSDAAERFDSWLRELRGQASIAVPISGAVFEVRQGYKSADSKRQNADLRYGVAAIRAGLLPVFAIMSAQVSEPVIRRYRASSMIVLRGTITNDPTTSTFAFFQEVVGYDLSSFFERNSARIQKEISHVVERLLSA